MKALNEILIALLTLCCTAPASLGADPPKRETVTQSPEAYPPVLTKRRLVPANVKLVRVVVVDKSGSMGQEKKLDVSVGEVLELARDKLPSPEAPFIIVPFDSNAHEPRIFTDLASLETYIIGLGANGGTSIASGLERGCDALEPYMGAAHLVVFIITDGEDNDEIGIEAAEKRLEKIFTGRYLAKLSNTVFIKRWDDANAKLVGRLKKIPGTMTIDLGDAKVVYSNIEPRARVLHATWLEEVGDPRLQVELELSVHVSGDAARAELPDLDVEIDSFAGVVQGDVHRQVSLTDDAPRKLSMVITFADGAPAADVPFRLTFSMPGKRLTRGALLPFLDPAALTLDVPLPVRVWTANATPILDVVGPAEWVGDGLSGGVELPVRLSLLIDAQPDVPWPGPARLRVNFDDPGVSFLDGDLDLQVPGPGHFEWEARIELDSILAADGTLPGSVDLRAVTELLDAPPEVRFSETTLEVGAHFAPPARLETRIDVHVAVLGSPRWIDLATETAEFDVEIDVRADGPVPAGTNVIITPLGSLSVTDPQAIPLGAGQASMRAVLSASLTARNSHEFAFEIEVPPDSGGRAFDAIARVPFQVVGPDPVVLALKFGGRDPRPELELFAATDLNDGVIDVVPVLISDPRAAASEKIPVQIMAKGLGVAHRGDLAVGRRSRIRFDLPSASGSLVDDTVHLMAIEVVPVDGISSVVGSRTVVRITQEAWMKTIFALAALAITAIVSLVLIGKVLIAKDNGDDLEAEQLQDEPLDREPVS